MIKPLSGYILVSPIKEETQSGGIYLPEDINDKPSKGKVLVCGSEFLHESGKYIPCPVKVGDIICFKKWTNQEVKYEGKEYLLVRFDELLATL